MAKKKAKPTTPAEKPAAKRSLAANRRRRRARANPAPERSAARANPPIATDLVQVILPGFGAYALTRVLARLVYAVVQKKWPKLGKHAHAAAGVLSATGVWFFAHKVKAIAKYHDGVVMGTSLAALQGVAQTYMPAKYSWLLGDPRPEDVTPATATVLPPIDQPHVTAGDEYSYLEEALGEVESSPVRRARTVAPPKSKSKQVASTMAMAGGAPAGVQLDPDLMDELDLDEDVDDLYSGAFAN